MGQRSIYTPKKIFQKNNLTMVYKKCLNGICQSFWNVNRRSCLIYLETSEWLFKDVEDSLFKCVDTGTEMRKQFVNGCFLVEDKTAPDKSFFKLLPRSKLKIAPVVKICNLLSHVQTNGQWPYISKVNRSQCTQKVPLNKVFALRNTRVSLHMFWKMS